MKKVQGVKKWNVFWTSYSLNNKIYRTVNKELKINYKMVNYCKRRLFFMEKGEKLRELKYKVIRELQWVINLLKI